MAQPSYRPFVRRAHHSKKARPVRVERVGHREIIGKRQSGIVLFHLAHRPEFECERPVGLLDDLQQAGLIVRERSEQDRRAHALGLTPRGRLILKKANAHVAAHEKRVARRLGADNYRRALAALSQFDTD